LWYNNSDKEEIAEMGIVVPVNMSPLHDDYVKTINIIAALNPNISFYYYDLIDNRSATCELKIWQ